MQSETGTTPLQTRDGACGVTHYTRQGRGPTLVFIHGVGMNAAVWRPQIAALSANFDVVAYDMLGHGGSMLPPAGARLADYADQLLALMDSLGIGKAHVVGHSMGALVATQFALSHPERVLRLVAMNAVHCRSSEQQAAVRARAAALDGRIGGVSVDGTIARWFGDPVAPAHAAVAEQVRDYLANVDPVGYARTYTVFASADGEHREPLKGLAVPALFITGAGDANSSPAMSQAMARLAPLGSAEIVPGERHMMALTKPDDINRRLAAFLSATNTAPAPEVTTMTQPDIDPKAFRQALGAFATGVTIVSTFAQDGTPRGFTANSFTSVSLDPPLVLVCIAKTASGYPIFSASPHFSISVLAEGQKDVSSLFASKAPDKFERARWSKGPAGSPVIEEAAAWFDCLRHDVVDAGDHVILIGRVVGFDNKTVNPLGYCRGAYVNFGLSLDAATASAGRAQVGAILECDRRILFHAAKDGALSLPTAHAVGPASDASSLTGFMQRLGVDGELGFLFAVFEEPQRDRSTPARHWIFYRGTLAAPPADGADLTMVAFHDIAWDRIGDEAIRSMLARYVKERREDVYGIYVGDSAQGTVQPLARRA